jgi:anti-sigma factor ChrR (cupin superfamily)
MATQSKSKRKVVHADIKLNNKPELATRFLDVPNMPWEATKFPGIQIKVLYSDDDGRTTALFKLAPGAIVPLHEHTALEQTFVIEGTIEDRRIANMDHSCADTLAFYDELDCVALARRMLTDLGIKNYALCRSNSEETNLP